MKRFIFGIICLLCLIEFVQHYTLIIDKGRPNETAIYFTWTDGE